MKLRTRTRIISACLALCMLATACGNTAENVAEDLSLENVKVEKESTELVASAISNTDVVAVAEEIIEEPQYTEEELEWLDSVMPNVEDSLNVRAEANEEAEIVGRLAKGDRATVLEVGADWTKVISGNVEGYVKNSYCIYGLDALAYAKENCKTVATTTTNNLRMREGMGTDYKIAKVVEEGKELVVNTLEETNEEWVAIEYGDKTYYVSSEYVDVEMRVGTGLTMDEIAAIEKAEAEERAAEEAARAKAAAAAAEKAANTAAVLASVDNVTLLAAIISCEAGGEGYDAQLAVGAVIMNRVRSNRHPNTIQDVLLARGQFPPATNGKLTKRLTSGKVSQTSYDAAHAALAGQDNTYGCLHFNRNSGGRQGLVIGNLVFW